MIDIIDNSHLHNLNISDKYKYDRLTKWSVDLIKKDLQQNSFPYAVMMENFAGDFNISSCLRACNAMGGSEMFYLGRKHYDKRGAVGTYNYTQMTHLSSREELLKLKEKYILVALENTVPGSESIYDYEWDKNSLIIVGEEGVGITPETLGLCDKFVYIPQYGSVRSMNAAAAVSIALYDYTAKFKK